MMSDNLQQDMKRLKQWAKSLERSIESTTPEIESILDGHGDLPTNCPSRGSLAAMAFRNIEKALDEVNGACQDIKKRLLE